MALTVQKFEQIARRAKSVFINEASNAETSFVQALATTECSDGAGEDYMALDEAPQLQLMRDELQTEREGDAASSLDNDTYAIGIADKRTELEADRMGAIMRRVQGMTRVAARFPNSLLIRQLELGTGVNGWDGVSFFSNAHPDRGSGSTQDNLLGGTGVSVANIKTDLDVILQTFAGFEGANGEKTHGDGITSLDIMLPWAMRLPFSEVLGREVEADGATNVAFRDFNIRMHVSGRLSDANDWYALHTGGVVKPLIYQQRMPLSFEVTAPGSGQYVNQEIITYKVRWRGNFGFGHWADAIKVVN